MLSHLINVSITARIRRSIAILLTASSLAFAVPQALAQTGGEGALEGTVTDPTGAAIPNATVTATNQASKVSTTRTSTSAGLFSITPLIPGVYTVTVKADGFTTLTQQNLEVNGLNVTGFNPKLSPGAVDQSVTVTEAPPQLQTTSATVGDVITNETYESLPVVLNNQQRDPTSLSTLAVGAQGGNARSHLFRYWRLPRRGLPQRYPDDHLQYAGRQSHRLQHRSDRERRSDADHLVRALG